MLNFGKLRKCVSLEPLVKEESSTAWYADLDKDAMDSANKPEALAFAMNTFKSKVRSPRHSIREFPPRDLANASHY